MIQAVGGADKIKGMGVGVETEIIITERLNLVLNLPWKGIIPLAVMFEEKLGIPTALTNMSANAAAIGEMTYGAAGGMEDFIMITLGTGVGGIVINGQLVYGHTVAGELGTRDWLEDQRGCGRRGCLETYCLQLEWLVLHVNSWFSVPNRAR